MTNWRIQLKRIGRQNVTRTINITAKTLPAAEQITIRECSKHLRSRDVCLEDNLDLTYTVIAGNRAVGTAQIRST